MGKDKRQTLAKARYGVKEVTFEASSALAFLLSFIIRTGTLNQLRYIPKLSHHISCLLCKTRLQDRRIISVLHLIRKRSPFEPRTPHPHPLTPHLRHRVHTPHNIHTTPPLLIYTNYHNS